MNPAKVSNTDQTQTNPGKPHDLRIVPSPAGPRRTIPSNIPSAPSILDRLRSSSQSTSIRIKELDDLNQFLTFLKRQQWSPEEKTILTNTIKLVISFYIEDCKSSPINNLLQTISQNPHLILNLKTLLLKFVCGDLTVPVLPNVNSVRLAFSSPSGTLTLTPSNDIEDLRLGLIKEGTKLPSLPSLKKLTIWSLKGTIELSHEKYPALEEFFYFLRKGDNIDEMITGDLKFVADPIKQRDGFTRFTVIHPKA